jgi:hypothetical protein
VQGEAQVLQIGRRGRSACVRCAPPASSAANTPTWRYEHIRRPVLEPLGTDIRT